MLATRTLAIVASKSLAGTASIAKLIERLRDVEENSLPETARLALSELAEQIEMLMKRNRPIRAALRG